VKLREIFLGGSGGHQFEVSYIDDSGPLGPWWAVYINCPASTSVEREWWMMKFNGDASASLNADVIPSQLKVAVSTWVASDRYGGTPLKEFLTSLGVIE